MLKCSNNWTPLGNFIDCASYVLALCSVIKKQIMIPFLKSNYIPIRVITEEENKNKKKA